MVCTKPVAVTTPVVPRRVVPESVGGRADDSCVVTEVGARPLSIREAERAVVAEREAIGRLGAAYSRFRTGLDTRATARAHAEFGFAVLEFVHACVSLSEAEDRVDPVWAAARNRAEPMSTAVGPAHDQAWRDYQAARRSGDCDAIVAARAVWRDALMDWQLQLHKRQAAEDQDHAEKLRRRVDERMRLHPREVFPPPPRSRREEVVRESRERERQESIRRAERNLSHPWDRWPRSRRSGADLPGGNQVPLE